MSNLRVSCRLNDNLIGAPKHHDAAKQPPVTPLQPGGNRPAPLTPQSVPRSVFKARSGVSDCCIPRLGHSLAEHAEQLTNAVTTAMHECTCQFT